MPEREFPYSPANTPAPPGRDDQKSDTGCLIMLFVFFIGVFLFPAFFFLGGAPFIVPLIILFLVAIVSVPLNPLEHQAKKAKWMGRIVTFLILATLLGLAAWHWWFKGLDDGQPHDIRQKDGGQVLPVQERTGTYC